jgi:tetratricopeptide (TPR) repeat protein
MAALVVLASAAPAAADGDAPTDGPARENEARQAMQRGINLYGRGDAQGALAEYERAKALVPDANLPYRYAAEALLTLGRTAEAIANLEGYLKQNPNVSDAEAVRSRIAALREKLAPGHVRIQASAAGAKAHVDGGPSLDLPAELDLAAGPHTISAEHPAFRPSERVVMVVGGKSVDVLVTLEASPAPTPPTRDASPWPTVGLVATAAGGAVVATALVLDLSVLRARFDDVEHAAARNDAGLVAYQDDARTTRTAVQITYVVGISLVVAGLGLFFFAPKTTARAAQLLGPVRF